MMFFQPNSVPSSAMFRSIATLVTGSILARLIGILSMPILTRLYGPDSFGTLSVFNSIVFLLIPVVSFCFMLGIPLPRSKLSAFNLLLSSLVPIYAFCLLLAGGGTIFGGQLAELLNLQDIPALWCLLAAGLAGGATYEALTMWATRERSYRAIAKNQVRQAAMGEGIKLLLGAAGIRPLGLLVGQIVGHSAGNIAFARLFAKDFAPLVRRLSWRRLNTTLSRYASLPKYRMPAQILLALSAQAPLLIVAAIYDADTTGQFGLATLAIALPFSIIGQSVSRAFYGEISVLGKYQPSRIYCHFIAVAGRLAIIILIPSVALLVFGQMLFPLIFGDQWTTAGNVVSAFGLYLLPQFVSSPLLRTLDVYDRHNYLLYIYFQRLVIVIAVFSASSFYNFDFMTTVYSYSIGMLLHYALQFSIIFSVARYRAKNHIND